MIECCVHTFLHIWMTFIPHGLNPGLHPIGIFNNSNQAIMVINYKPNSSKKDGDCG